MNLRILFSFAQKKNETLSIIAYKQPVTKAEIEKIRGVKCDHAINKLMDYDLVRELGRLDAPGRPILLGTTEEFLRCFGVQGLDELPEMDTVQMEDFSTDRYQSIGSSRTDQWEQKRRNRKCLRHIHMIFLEKGFIGSFLQNCST